MIDVKQLHENSETEVRKTDRFRGEMLSLIQCQYKINPRLLLHESGHPHKNAILGPIASTSEVLRVGW